MKNISFLVLTLLLFNTSFAQYFRITNDTTLMKSELILDNSTKGKTGSFIRNKGNGRTDFAYAVDSVYSSHDTMFVRRGDGLSFVKIPPGYSDAAARAANANLYPSLNIGYVNPPWIVSLPASKITGLPPLEGINLTGTVAQIRAMSTKTGQTYFSTDFGGGTWVDKGLNDGVYADDGATHIITVNGHNIERIFSGAADVKWFPSLAAAIAANVDLTIGSEIQVAANITFPATMHIEFNSGGALNVASGKTVTFASPMKADVRQWIFKGAGSVILSSTVADKASVCWFGAKGDASFNSSTAIQKTINSCGRLNKIYFPPFGNQNPYRVDTTIQLYSSEFAFVAWEIYGDLRQDDMAGPLNARLDYTALSGSLFNIRGGRYVDIHDLNMTGKNLAPVNLDLQNPNIRAESLWVSAGVNTSATNHLAAVTIDGPGPSVSLSQLCTIRKCDIRFFYVAISISASGEPQGDNVHVSDNQISYNTYAISSGNVNDRSMEFARNVYHKGFTVFTNRKFGSGLGSKFSVVSGQVTDFYQIFDMVNSYGGNCNVDGLYAENTARLGSFGTALGITSQYTFNGCHLDFTDSQFTGEPYDLKLNAHFYSAETNGIIQFIGGEYRTKRKVLAFATVQDDGNKIVFNGTRIDGESLEEIVSNRETGVVFDNCAFGVNVTTDYNKTVYLNMGLPGRKKIGNNSTSLLNAYLDESAPGYFNFDKNNIIARKNYNRFYIPTGGLTNTTGLTYTWGAINDGYFKQLLSGDLLYTTMTGDVGASEYFSAGYAPALRVLSINHTTRTVTFQKLGFEAVIGTEVFLKYSYAVYALPIAADVTTGSATVTGVTNASQLQVGDCITFAKNEYNPYRIKTIAGSTITLTLPYAGPTKTAATLVSAPYYSVEALSDTGLTVQEAHDAVVNNSENNYVYKSNTDGKLVPTGINDDGTYVTFVNRGLAGTLPVDNSLSSEAMVYKDGFWARSTQFPKRQEMLDSIQAEINRNPFAVGNASGTGDTLFVTTSDTLKAKRLRLTGATVSKNVTADQITYTIDGIITGLAQLSGNGSSTSFDIVLAITPSWVGASNPANAASVGISYTEPIPNGLRVHFTTAPASGTNNIQFYYSYK